MNKKILDKKSLTYATRYIFAIIFGGLASYLVPQIAFLGYGNGASITWYEVMPFIELVAIMLMIGVGYLIGAHWLTPSSTPVTLRRFNGAIVALLAPAFEMLISGVWSMSIGSDTNSTDSDASLWRGYLAYTIIPIVVTACLLGIFGYVCRRTKRIAERIDNNAYVAVPTVAATVFLVGYSVFSLLTSFAEQRLSLENFLMWQAPVESLLVPVIAYFFPIVVTRGRLSRMMMASVSFAIFMAIQLMSMVAFYVPWFAQNSGARVSFYYWAAAATALIWLAMQIALYRISHKK